MKKFLSSVICASLFLTNLSTLSANTEAVDEAIEYAVSQAEKEIEIDENIMLEVDDYEVLYDVELKPNYVLIDFSKGYAIIGKDNHIISEYNIATDSTPYDDFDQSKIWVYGGPFNYLQVDKATLYQRDTNPLNVSQEAIEKNKIFLQGEKGADISARASGSWTGLPSSRFTRYDDGKWLNNKTNYPTSAGYPSKGICGTIASAIFLAYLQDYVKADFVPSSIRTKNSSSPGKLITTLYKYIDKGKNGTIHHDVCASINGYLKDYSYQASRHAVLYSASTFKIAKREINAGYPVVIGMVEILGSTRGDRWVTVYQYLDKSGTANDRYKCVTNQKKGEYAVSINVSWTVGIVNLFDY